jgi:chromosome partitioning protein
MDILSLTSTKGGVGKSTLAVNLAGAFSSSGRTALTDEDDTMQTAHSWIEAAPEQCGVQLLPSGRPPAADVQYWVIDVEGRPALADMVQLSQRTTVLIPTGANGTELEPTVKLWNHLRDQGADLSRVRAVITKAPPSGSVGQQARDHLKRLGLNVCCTVIRQYAAHQRAQEQRVLVRDVPDLRAGNAWADIVQLSQEVF